MSATPLRIVLIGAGSRSFGPSTIRDVMLSKPLSERGVELVLMDKAATHLAEAEDYARHVARKLERGHTVRATTDLATAVDGADFVVTAIEVNRYLYWAQDFHIPRQYGFRQPYGENGGPGGIFHALRNMKPTVEIAREMQKRCPQALMLNFSNPEHMLCEAVSRLTSIRAYGLCHGVFMGQRQIAQILGRKVEELEMTACGINHFLWFQTIKDRKTGEDLYPRLRELDLQGDLLSDWHEIALSRILLRRFGLWAAPGANHHGEYIHWADEFVASEAQYFYDPAEGHPWQTGQIPDFLYTLNGDLASRPWEKPKGQRRPLAEDPLILSGEISSDIMEAVGCGVKRELPAVSVPNRGAIPNLPEDGVVEVPATGDGQGVRSCQMQPLPEAIAAMIRLRLSIHKLVVEAFAEQSKAKLLQAVLLDPCVTSYRRAVAMVDEMLNLQRDMLPKLG